MEMQKSLVDRVITQIEIDMRGDDLTALEELLKRVPTKVLESYLPEVDENLQIEIDDISHIGEGLWVGIKTEAQSRRFILTDL